MESVSKNMSTQKFPKKYIFDLVIYHGLILCSVVIYNHAKLERERELKKK